MSTVERACAAPASVVWEVLADPWSYPSWVVGASRIRDAQGPWPQPGALIHHSVGVWPLLLDDVTEVVSAVPGSELVLQAKGRPVGEARVVLTLRPGADGCTVRMEETVVSGPGAALPDAVTEPAIAWRNTETLRRLVLIAEGRAGRSAGTSG